MQIYTFMGYQNAKYNPLCLPNDKFRFNHTYGQLFAFLGFSFAVCEIIANFASRNCA